MFTPSQAFLNNYASNLTGTQNPFGGGSYMPGNMAPTQDSIAGVLGLPPGARIRTYAPGLVGGPQGEFSDIDQMKKDARRQLRLDLMEPPNPFGGGSAPYVGPV